MKKNLLIALFLITVIFPSCKKEDDELSPENLAGTVWLTDDKTENLEFISKTQVNYNWKDYYRGEYYPQVENGIYTITGNKIVIDFGYGDDDLMNGIIDGNTITVAYDGDVFVVTKQ